MKCDETAERLGRERTLPERIERAVLGVRFLETEVGRISLSHEARLNAIERMLGIVPPPTIVEVDRG